MKTDKSALKAGSASVDIKTDKSDMSWYNPVPSILRQFGMCTREDIHEFVDLFESANPEAAIKDALEQGTIKLVNKSEHSDLFDEFNLA